jgi:Bacterial Ig-like domain (group 2)
VRHQPLTIGESVTDTLATTGCKLADGSFIKRYSLTLPAPTAVRLDATSTQFDSYLIVQESGAAGTKVAEDDDSGPGLNAQVLQQLNAGTFVITVTSATAGETGAFTLSVNGPENAGVAVTLNPATVTLTPGQTQPLTAGVTGSANTSVAWRSSAPTIATVSSTGVVRAITAGAATITATAAADPSKTATSSVTVNAGADANLDLPLVYLTQSVQTQTSGIPLVFGRPTIARVFARGSRSGLGNAAVRVRFFNGATELGTITGNAVIATAFDEACCSADIPVPDAFIRDGVTLIADVDPGNAIAESNEGDNSFPLTGNSKPIRVVTVPPINIQLVPIRHNTTGNVGPNTTTITGLIRRMYPIGQMNVTVHPEYATDTPPLTDGASWIAMLREMEGLRALENSRAYFFGVLHQVAANGIIGIATIRGFAGVGISGPDAIANETLTHEFGHSFGRFHAPSPGCGSPANVDANFPRADGTTGFYGYDVALNAVQLPSRFDVMGYCNGVWTSEYTYLGILDYLRSGVIPAAATVASPGAVPSVLITGSFDDGAITVDPAITHTATPSSSRANGRFVAEGFATDGRVLFSHRFDGNAIGDADPAARIFAVNVPYDARVSGAVSRIAVREVAGGGTPAVLARTGTYSGTAGGISLRVDSDPQVAVRASGAGRFDVSWNAARYPSAVVRNRQTGQVLAIGQRGRLAISAAALTELDLLLSDGVGSTTRALSSGGAP